MIPALAGHNARMQQAQAPKPLPEPRSAYRVFRSIATRWMDNDAYGHVNNTVYFSFYDLGMCVPYKKNWAELEHRTQTLYLRPL